MRARATSNSFFLDVQTPKGKVNEILLTDALGAQVEYSRKHILPKLWRYQAAELDTLINNSKTEDLRISTQTIRWVLRDIVKNPLYFILTAFRTHRLEICNADMIRFPLELHNMNRDAKIWVSRTAVSKGVAPTNLDESLEYDRLRSPLSFDVLVTQAISQSEFTSVQIFEERHFDLMYPGNQDDLGYFTDYIVVKNSHVFHGKIAVHGSSIIQMSNQRLEVLRRSPGYLEKIDGEFHLFKAYRNIGRVDRAIFFGSNRNWFHFIVECLTRITTLPVEGRSNIPIILDSTTHKNIREICKVLTGLEPIILKPGEVLDVDHLIVGREHGVIDSIDSKARADNLNLLRNDVLKALQVDFQTPFRKVYIRRPLRLFRPLQNEFSIARYLHNAAFESIYPEELTVQEFVNILSETKIVVVESGAAMTNLMFAHPEIEILELNPGDGGFGFWKDFLDIFGIRTEGIVGRKRRFGRKGLAVDGYKISLKELKQQLRKMTEN